MLVLAVNCGSSSLKYAVVEAAADGGERVVATGAVERIGRGGPDGHGPAMATTLDRLRRGEGGVRLDDVDAVGHRVVHGGERTDPVLLDDDALATIERAAVLAPLHNAPALAAVRLAREQLPAVPMVAVFDTAFHTTMPARATTYAIPGELAERHRIRRHGFHGLAHRSMVERWAAATGAEAAAARLVTLQLGSGVSAAAVDRGRSVDTTMGLTPLEGLVMGTRSGDVDPALPGILARAEGVDVQQVEGWLTTRSGLLGVSGSSAHLHDLVEAEAAGDERAALAVELFCYRVRKQVGAYLAALGGADAVCFGGGIGERSPAVRARVCEGLAWAGLVLDDDRNAAATGDGDTRISADGSGIGAWALAVDEATLVARDTAAIVRGDRPA